MEYYKVLFKKAYALFWKLNTKCYHIFYTYIKNSMAAPMLALCNVDANDYDYNKRFVPAELDKVCDHLKLAKVMGPDMNP